VALVHRMNWSHRVNHALCAWAPRSGAACSAWFDEGPVFAESYAYLERRGIAVVRQVLRAEAADVLDQYLRSGGIVYNG